MAGRVKEYLEEKYSSMRRQQSLSLKGNIVRVLSTNVLVAIAGFIGSFIFPKILSVDAYALYHTFTLYLGYITILHLGFPSGMVINYAGKDYEQINDCQFKAEVKIILGVLVGFTGLFLVMYLFSSNVMLLYVTLAIIPVDFISIYKALLQSWNQFNTYSYISSILAIGVPSVAVLYYVVFKELTGEVYISIYLIIYWIVSLKLLAKIHKKVRGVKAYKIFTEENFLTEKTGFAMLMGNYINVLFVAADKQFVKWFFSNVEFAYYSFGMSMQSIMTFLISSIAQPLFPTMAQGRFEDEEYNILKDLLIVLGSVSGFAYFFTSFVVKNFISTYSGSLDIVRIYFVVFPVMAVINCLYINLYKIKGMMKTYIFSLIGVLILAIVLNCAFIYIYPNSIGIAIGTIITYFIWFLSGFKQFRFLHFKFKDISYVLMYILGYFCITAISNDMLGILIYAIYIGILVILCYKDIFSLVINETGSRVF